MVLTLTRRMANNKENVLADTPVHFKTDSRIVHRNRVHPQKASLLPPKPAIQKRVAVVPTSLDSLRSLIVEESPECRVGTSSSHVAPPQRKLSLPKKLQRPLYKPISPAALSAIDPDLAEIPVEYIQKKLLSSGDMLYATTTRMTTQFPKGSLPRELEVIMSDMSADIPTHILAVYSETSPFNKQRISLYPAHALVLATQCAHLPPISTHAHGGDNETKTTLPVLPLRVPSPRTFTLLVQYLYTHQTKNILSVLIPVPSRNSSQEELSQKLTQLCTTPRLLSLLSTVHGLWSNVAALGIFDEELWQTIDFSWTTLITALEMKIPGQTTTS